MLDTTAVSIFLKISAVPGARREALEGYLFGKVAVISFVSLAELYFWAVSHQWGERKRQDLKERLRAYGVLDSNRATADCWAVKKSECNGLGINVQPHDMWIAAAAIQYGLTIVSNDRIFAKIPGIKVHALP